MLSLLEKLYLLLITFIGPGKESLLHLGLVATMRNLNCIILLGIYDASTLVPPGSFDHKITCEMSRNVLEIKIFCMAVG